MEPKPNASDFTFNGVLQQPHYDNAVRAWEKLEGMAKNEVEELVKVTAKQLRAERINIVNEIIKDISERGRNFFKGKLGVAEILEKNGRYYYKSEYHGESICLSIPSYRRPRRWHHGGTMLALCKDFIDFIKTGKKSNHNHGYGGLYCPHWGYKDEDMQAIQENAKKLGYL